MTKKIIVVTGEASGDLHAANLVRELKKKDLDLEFFGMGGPELKSLGVDILFDATKVSVVGVVEVIGRLKDIFQAQYVLRKAMERNRPDLLILVDLPDFNLLLAPKAKPLGIPVFYYIAPQVWAWRRGRVRTIAQKVNKMGVIFPFEKKFFEQEGIDTQYVGHPLLDVVSAAMTREEFCHFHNIPEDSRIIGLFPGSRKKEVESLLPVFLGAAEILQHQLQDHFVFVIPKAPTVTEEMLRASGLDQYHEKLDTRIISENRYDMMAACDAVVSKSGTIILELAILEKPMVVTYKLAPVSYWIAKLMVKLDFFSLANLIAEKEVVPELLQHEVTAETVASELHSLLTDESRKQKMKLDLAEVRKKLGERGASRKAADAVLEMLN